VTEIRAAWLMEGATSKNKVRVPTSIAIPPAPPFSHPVIASSMHCCPPPHPTSRHPHRHPNPSLATPLDPLNHHFYLFFQFLHNSTASGGTTRPRPGARGYSLRTKKRSSDSFALHREGMMPPNPDYHRASAHFAMRNVSSQFSSPAREGLISTLRPDELITIR